MADLSDLQSAQTVKIVGADSAGIETNAAVVKNPSTPATAADPALVVAISPGTPIQVTLTSGGDTSGIAFGEITLSNNARVAVRKTPYIEQTTNAQRSMASSSANDSVAGTGARTVKIIYYDAAMAGPFTETITLNGVTFVNTTNTNICYIEDIIVQTAGSTGSNVGTLTLKAATAGGGVTISTIAPTDNTTLYAHHYTAVGKTTSIISLNANSTGTSSGHGAIFDIRTQKLLTVDDAELQVSDIIRLAGGTSNLDRIYQALIRITGPARTTVYCTPESNPSNTFRASFDFSEI